MTSAERQQRANYLIAERGALAYHAWLIANGGSAEDIAKALAHAKRHAADAALVGQRRESPL